jgi:NADH:ubiquinone oxidoreductase subunit C
VASAYEELPGFVELREAYGETTVVVEAESLLEACRALRDEHGFTFLADITPTDYLGWAEGGVSGYIGTATGRTIMEPMTQGLQALPAPRPKRFSVSYHLLLLRRPPVRLRLQVWVDDGEALPSVIELWPTADWHEREAWDMMGIPFTGHPNLARLLMDEDWEGHPLRKDYPLGGEPVRFSGEE